MTREELNESIREELIKEDKKVIKRKIFKYSIITFFIIFIFTISFISYTSLISTIKIIIREERIINSKLPDSFNGLKILQFSDLHFGSTMTNKNMKEITKLVNETNPDLIVFTGDLILPDYSLTNKENEKLITYLQNMRAKIGKYAIFGDEDNERISTILNQGDFTILRNEYELIYNNDKNAILLIGLSSKLKDQNIDKAYSYFKEESHNHNIYTITILHEPDYIDDIINYYPTDLFLAGHSHNGNIRVPINHFSPFRYEGSLKYYKEYYEVEGYKLYISSGLGTPKGFRLFCRPSMSLFRISNK